MTEAPLNKEWKKQFETFPGFPMLSPTPFPDIVYKPLESVSLSSVHSGLYYSGIVQACSVCLAVGLHSFSMLSPSWVLWGRMTKVPVASRTLPSHSSTNLGVSGLQDKQLWVKGIPRTQQICSKKGKVSTTEGKGNTWRKISITELLPLKCWSKRNTGGLEFLLNRLGRELFV